MSRLLLVLLCCCVPLSVVGCPATPNPANEPYQEAPIPDAAPDTNVSEKGPQVEGALPDVAPPVDRVSQERPPVRPEPPQSEPVLSDGGGADGPATPERMVTPEQVVPESSNKICSFNKDCPAQERCECTEEDGCFCKVGTRGKGQNGVDTCTDGNDCASAVCVEGSGGTFYCSGECQSDTDCQPALPQCTTVAFVGRICIRKPN